MLTDKAGLVAGMSPLSISDVRRWPGQCLLRVRCSGRQSQHSSTLAASTTDRRRRPFRPVDIFLCLVWLLIPASASAQEVSAFPDTPRPVRRLDAAAPVLIGDVAASPFVAPAIEPAKTPIRRLADGDAAAGGRSGAMVWVVMLGIIATAVGLSFWARSSGRTNHWKLPASVFQVLGKASISGNQSVTLLRLGERVLLVSSSGATMQTLAVVTDPAEVAAMTSECLSRRKSQIAEPVESPRRRERRAATQATIDPEPRAVAGRIVNDGAINAGVAGVRGAEHG